jgi:hypothetical protein
MVVIAAIGVALAIIVLVPPLAFVLLASAVPALVVTEIKAYRRRGRGEPVSASQHLMWFLGFTILFPIVLGAVVFALFLVCTALMR